MNLRNSDGPVGASFRDPAGSVFILDGQLYRQVNRSYQADYRQLVDAGLYRDLTQDGLLISHQEVDVEPPEPMTAFEVIQPDRLAFVSYPYEWSFSQLKDAALVTLEVQRRALLHGMSLKDASAYNVQFHRGRATLVDTLSFERYQEGLPWIAYRQFCRHFLCPLALMAYSDIRLSQLLRANIDGIPVDLASRLLPLRTRLRFSLLAHIHLHATAQRRYAGRPATNKTPRMSKTGFLGLIDSLESSVRRLVWRPAGTDWADYYAVGHHSPEAIETKKGILSEFLDQVRPRSVWDIGANTGLYSRLASQRGIFTVAWDIDPAAVEQNYLECVRQGETSLLPLLLDLTNPSPALGWRSRERMSMIERGPADMVFALALIHHLIISNNVPLDQLAGFFGELGLWLVVEFVPKSDPQVQQLLSTRADIFPEYTQEEFERAFGDRFELESIRPVPATGRTLYLMRCL
jgi:hypothetical protein